MTWGPDTRESSLSLPQSVDDKGSLCCSFSNDAGTRSCTNMGTWGWAYSPEGLQCWRFLCRMFYPHCLVVRMLRSPSSQLHDDLGGHNSVECWAVINKQHISYTAEAEMRLALPKTDCRPYTDWESRFSNFTCRFSGNGAIFQAYLEDPVCLGNVSTLHKGDVEPFWALKGVIACLKHLRGTRSFQCGQLRYRSNKTFSETEPFVLCCQRHF